MKDTFAFTEGAVYSVFVTTMRKASHGRIFGSSEEKRTVLGRSSAEAGDPSALADRTRPHRLAPRSTPAMSKASQAKAETLKLRRLHIVWPAVFIFEHCKSRYGVGHRPAICYPTSLVLHFLNSIIRYDYGNNRIIKSKSPCDTGSLPTTGIQNCIVNVSKTITPSTSPPQIAGDRLSYPSSP